MFKLNKITNFVDTHPIGRIFNLGKKKVVWKKVTELTTGMKIAIAKEETMATWSNGQMAKNDNHPTIQPSDSDVLWDEIVSIKKVGRERVYDIEVEGTHNFVGNGILAHNTHISDQIGAFANIIAANIKAGAVIASKITTDGFTAFQGTIDHLLITSGLVAGNIQTKLISPLADGTDVTVQIGTATESGKFAVQNSQGTEVASIDASGSAKFAGDATVSGTLYAGAIKSQSLDEIQALLTKVQTDKNLLKDAANWNVNTASSSAVQQFNSLAATDLYITNQAAINSLSVTNTLTVGSDLVFQSSQDPIYNIQYTSIDTLSAPLKLQSLAMAPLEIMAGLVTIDTHGNVNIAGDLFVAGEITTQTGFKIQDSRFNDIASVDASGSAQFNNLSTQGLTIAGATSATASAVVNGMITTNATAGSAVIPSGISEIVIRNPKVTDYTLVYVTPTSTTENYVLYVKSKQAGQFVVGFSSPITVDTSFNWWIVQVTQ